MLSGIWRSLSSSSVTLHKIAYSPGGGQVELSAVRATPCCSRVAEKRRFIKREPAPEPADFDVEPAGKINNQQTVTVADAAINDSNRSRASTSSLLNGHTTVDCQQSKETILVNESVRCESKSLSYAY